MLRQRENGIIQNTQFKGEEKKWKTKRNKNQKSNRQKTAMNMVDDSLYQ